MFATSAGKVFDNEIECQGHEILEKIGNHFNGVILFNGNKQVLSFDTVIASSYDEVWGIYIEDESAIPFIEEVFRFCEIISPWSIDGGNNRKTTGFIFMTKNIIVGIFPRIKLKN